MVSAGWSVGPISSLLLSSHPTSLVDGTQATQVNHITTHANLPLLCTAHEDTIIRFMDVGSGKCVHSQVGHVDSVSSLDFSPFGDALASGGHDGSVRVWDVRTYSCLQDIMAHRRKGDEGVCCVQYHPTLPWLGSSGADSVVKIHS
ncbi:striatin-3-like protein [Piptocephalis cylindrospora]|uniref:Striatin-3-like protein n=1 Tax=Piptocephalis cylindrospora TaxID=1907219 RepID=A0A4P9Y3K9_9FUNG|nr:striatin-3-like protein [Piptocephalis cylindrospora]|eukprot:RKP13284.1 striatin-3-like protein [Piptocephalis cylindrospora]